MKVELTEVLWLDENLEFSLTDLALLSGLAEVELQDLAEHGVIAPIDPDAAQWTFCARCIATARTAYRLRNDLELDSHSLALALSLLERIRELEAQVRELHAKQSQRIR